MRNLSCFFVHPDYPRWDSSADLENVLLLIEWEQKLVYNDYDDSGVN